MLVTLREFLLQHRSLKYLSAVTSKGRISQVQDVPRKILAIASLKLYLRNSCQILIWKLPEGEVGWTWGDLQNIYVLCPHIVWFVFCLCIVEIYLVVYALVLHLDSLVYCIFAPTSRGLTKCQHFSIRFGVEVL